MVERQPATRAAVHAAPAVAREQRPARDLPLDRARNADVAHEPDHVRPRRRCRVAERSGRSSSRAPPPCPCRRARGRGGPCTRSAARSSRSGREPAAYPEIVVERAALHAGGFGGISLAVGVRWSFRNKDAGSVRSRRLRARPRTQSSGRAARPGGTAAIPASPPIPACGSTSSSRSSPACTNPRPR